MNFAAITPDIIETQTEDYILRVFHVHSDIRLVFIPKAQYIRLSENEITDILECSRNYFTSNGRITQ
jgi:hypothetical protein